MGYVSTSKARQASFGSLETFKANVTNSPLVVETISSSYDHKKESFTAVGVTIHQETMRLRCGALYYNKKKDILWAGKGVEILDSQGNRVHCRQAWLTGDLKKSVLLKVRILTAEQERITAVKVVKRGEKQICSTASYTSCFYCPDTLKEPLWSLHSKELIHDNEEKIMECKNVHMKFLGFPVAYVPYFYFPTERKSGVLPPSMGTTKELGYYIRQPYYWAISKNQDWTFSPIATTQKTGGGMLHSIYRFRGSKGFLNIQGVINACKKQFVPGKSEGQPEKEEIRIGSVRGFGMLECEVHFNPKWRLTSKEKGASDPTFLSTRPFFGDSTAPYLESQTTLEGFYPDSRNYIRCSGIRYQNLGPKDQTEGSCAVYPELVYGYETPSFWDKSCKMEVKAGAVSLYRKNNGPSMQRSTMDLKWLGVWQTPWGQSFEPFGFLGSAFYYSQFSNNSSRPIQTQNFFVDENTGSLLTLDTSEDPAAINGYYTKSRFFPQIGMKSRFPFMIQNIVFTPTVQVLTASCGINSYKIPNQDSQVVEFNDANIFSENRYAGYDRVDDGSRVNYGLETDWQPVAGGANLQMFLGQSYSFSQPPKSLHLVGVRRGYSDIVGRAQIIFSDMANLLYRVRCEVPSCRPALQEVGGSVGPKIFRVSSTYVLFRSEPSKQVESNQLFWAIELEVRKNWKVKVSATQDFKNQDGKQKVLDKGINVTYENECFSAGLGAQQSSYKMGELRPGCTFYFSLNFKMFGFWEVIRYEPQRFPKNSPAFGSY